MIQSFEEISESSLGDLVAGGWSIVSAGAVKDGLISDVVIVPFRESEIIYSESIVLSDEANNLYIVPTATIGEIFLGVLAFLLLITMIVKWIGGVMFRKLIDFKNRTR